MAIATSILATNPCSSRALPLKPLRCWKISPISIVIFVPIGGGSGAAGVGIIAHAINPAIQIIGVQSEASPAAYETWKQHRLVTAPNRTFAEGLATGVAFELPQAILRESPA